MSLDDFWNNPSATAPVLDAPVLDEYAPNPNTPPKLLRFTAKRFGLPVAGVIAPKDKHQDQVFIWQHDADGYAIGTAVERDSLDELRTIDP